jgi:hypothetical protein
LYDAALETKKLLLKFVRTLMKAEETALSFAVLHANNVGGVSLHATITCQIKPNIFLNLCQD